MSWICQYMEVKMKVLWIIRRFAVAEGKMRKPTMAIAKERNDSFFSSYCVCLADHQ